MMDSSCVVIWVCCMIMVLLAGNIPHSQAALNKLNDFILHYEPVHYDRNGLGEKHSRVKRSLSRTLYLEFHALGRPFRLRLRPDSSGFSPTLKIENSDGTLEDFDTSFMYSGEVKGQADSRVVGSVIDGTFRGVITLPEDDYYVEPSAWFFNDKQSFHSVIYAGKHVQEPKRVKRDAPVPRCGNSNPPVSDWMHEQQHSSIEERGRRSLEDSYHEPHQYSKYSEQANHRQRRDTSKAKVCSLYMQSDTMLWNHFDDGVKSHTMIKQEISSVFQTHVNGIKDIYENTVFEYSGVRHTGITFSVQRIKINSTKRDCPYDGNTPNNPFCNPYVDVSNFLNLNSLTNHDDFCLAYIFTYRDFADGTLGLAWVGSEGKASGGICERYKTFTENDRLVKKSLNTGIVTFLNYGSQVATKVSILTFAHEVGHNFGSPHDFPADCTPFTKMNNPLGNFIMFASATSGDRKNNNKFSACSVKNITLVLDAVINRRNAKYNCFQSTGVAFCGNTLKEEGEDCDCGYKDDCDDPCCYGRGSGNALDCRLRSNAQCSTVDPCCTVTCKINLKRDLCRNETQCSQEQFCNTQSAECPPSDPKPDNTPCNSNTQICRSGDCAGSICQKIGWEECSVAVNIQPGQTPPKRTDLCFISCSESTRAECFSTVDKELVNKAANLSRMLTEINESNGIQKPPGAHCDNMQGYCDVFHKCRGIDADGPLARLKNLIFNPATLNRIRDWIIKKWWAVLLMGVGLVVFMGVFIKICAVHTPSSNPMRRPARPLSLRRQRPPQQPPQPQHQQQHQRPQLIPKGPPPPYGAPSAPTGGPPPGKGKKRKRPEQRYQPATRGDIEMYPRT